MNGFFHTLSVVKFLRSAIEGRAEANADRKPISILSPAQVSNLGLSNRALLRAQPKQIEIEVKGGLRRIDVFLQGKSEGPAFTPGQDLHGGAKAGKAMIADIVNRIERKQEMIRQMVKKMTSEMGGDVFVGGIQASRIVLMRASLGVTVQVQRRRWWRSTRRRYIRR